MQCNLLTGLGEFLCVYFLCCLVKNCFSLTPEFLQVIACSWHLLLAWHRAGGRLSLCGLSTVTRALSNGRPVLCSEAGGEEVATPTRKGPAADSGLGHGFAFLLHSCPTQEHQVTFRKFLLSFQGPERPRPL